MQSYNIICYSKIINLDKYVLPTELNYRPQTNEYIIVEKNNNMCFLQITKIGHLKKEGVPYLLLVLTY